MKYLIALIVAGSVLGMIPISASAQIIADGSTTTLSQSSGQTQGETSDTCIGENEPGGELCS